MVDERLKQAFLVLLRQGLWGKKEVEQTDFPLTPDEWTLIYDMAVKQTVQGIIYDGISFLPKEQQPPRGLLIQWTVAIDQLERMNRRQNELLGILPQIFGQEPAIPFQLLKGQGIAAFYPKPMHRLCGDIDLYFGNETQTEKANQRIESLGVRVDRGQLGDSSYALNGIEIEHHKRLIDLYRPSVRKAVDRWETEQFAKGTSVPSPIANHLLQSTHILKHLLLQGIGLRQFCDLAVTLKAQVAGIDRQELEEICQTWKIGKWQQVIYALIVRYLGFPEEELPMKTHENPVPLMEEVWQTGNFGHGDERFGNRPDGFWKGKAHTLRVMLNKWRLSFRYAPQEISWYLTDLARKRIKELFTHESN